MLVEYFGDENELNVRWKIRRLRAVSFLAPMGECLGYKDEY